MTSLTEFDLSGNEILMNLGLVGKLVPFTKTQSVWV